MITFPDGFTVGSLNGQNVGNLTGGSGDLTASVVGQVVTLTRGGGAALVAGSTALSFALPDVTTPGTEGTTGSFTFATTTNADFFIDKNTAVPGVEIAAAGGGGEEGQGGSTGSGGGYSDTTLCFLYKIKCPEGQEPTDPIVDPVPSVVVEKDSQVPFTDIAGHWAEEVIEQAYLDGMISGKTATIFDPNGNITRRETAKVMVNFSGVTQETSLASGTFVDIADHWSKLFVETLRVKGWSEGYVDANEYRPDQAITRGEFTKLALEAFGYDPAADSSSFTDTAGKWYEGYAKKAKELGVVEGYAEDNTFRGDQPITRAEAVAIADRVAAL